MIVTRRIMILFFLSSLMISSGISFLVQSIYHSSESDIPQILSLIFVVAIIVIAGKLIQYQQVLNRAKLNLDEAQQLASLGSWERDIPTGRGYWSDNHYRLFNMQPRLVAPSLEEFFMMIHSDDREMARETVLGAIRTNGSYEMKYRIEGDYKNRIFLSRGKVLLNSDKKPSTLIGTLQDITVKERHDHLNEVLLKQKELFITRLGHDLKTPLTPLVAFLPLIRSRTEDPAQNKLLDLCINSVNHINELVVKTLKLARLTSPSELISSRVDLPLAPIAASAITRMTEEINNVGMSVENLISDDIVVRGTRDELEELFSQLISNAAIFSSANPKLTIEASSDAGVVTVGLKDNGIGLLPEDLDQIFDDFYKADHSRHLLNSSGLGLTICRKIVENHGGKITATSSGRGCGTLISFTLEAGGRAE